jgi:hypothetical protein
VVGPPPPPPALANAAAVAAATAPPALSRLESAAAEPSRAEIEQNAVLRTLRGYELAYEAMDVRAAAAVWPSVDRRALSRAFSGLKSQQLAIQNCEVNVDDTVAFARCRGTLEYVPKVGSPTPRSGSQEWMFRMQKLGTEWKIDDVNAHRISARSAAPPGEL